MRDCLPPSLWVVTRMHLLGLGSTVAFELLQGQGQWSTLNSGFTPVSMIAKERVASLVNNIALPVPLWQLQPMTACMLSILEHHEPIIPVHSPVHSPAFTISPPFGMTGCNSGEFIMNFGNLHTRTIKERGSEPCDW